MKKFTMKNEEFVCSNCHKEVPKSNYTARDHCPYCLYSIHIDNLPGDRSNNCRGMMRPIGIEKFKNTYKIIYECEKCKKIHKNIMHDDDNMELIIQLSVQN